MIELAGPQKDRSRDGPDTPIAIAIHYANGQKKSQNIGNIIYRADSGMVSHRFWGFHIKSSLTRSFLHEHTYCGLCGIVEYECTYV